MRNWAWVEGSGGLRALTASTTLHLEYHPEKLVAETLVVVVHLVSIASQNRVLDESDLANLILPMVEDICADGFGGALTVAGV